MDQLEGTVEQIVYYNPENGYAVFRFSVGDAKPVTIVGSFPPLSPGEVLKLKGAWELNPKFGKQFHVESFSLALPASVQGIGKFLASGLIKGIGPVLAERIVGVFGAETIAVLTDRPEKLKKVEGVGPVKLREIRRSWAEHRDIRDLIIFLQEHGVSTNLATKIHRQYGDKAFHVLRSDPYQLSLDIWGVGFKTADQLALKLGMDPGSPERVKAYVLYLMEKDNEARCLEDIAADEAKFDAALARLTAKKLLVREPLGQDGALYRPSLHAAQEEVARSLHDLAAVTCGTPPFDLDAAVSDAGKDLGVVLSPAQRLAVAECFRKKVLVITGGPGTGKTTIIKAVTDIFRRWGRAVILAAPTGRAAKRLSETTGQDARTIHRVLEFKPKLGTFRRNKKCPLQGEALVIDEFSMVDLPLMHSLLKAVPETMRLVLVGDKDQIPSVGPGTLLRDIIESGTVPVVRLDEIFRQDKESYIVLNAHRVNQGQGLVYPPKGTKDSDFYFIRQDDEQKAFETIVSLCQTRIPRWLCIPALSPEIQVISPMYKGLVGVDNLNLELQQRLNPLREGLKWGNREFRVRDKVMQIRNDYEKDVFNGDIGIVAHVDRPRLRVVVDFEGRSVLYEKDDLNDLVLAYAVSVHKAQGSEYQAVVMPLLTQHFIMLQRNLFYTALTRAPTRPST
jgi:exodeoxyribonuclease V alpha subunit